MRKLDVMTLFDYNYWADWSVLAATAAVPTDAFTGPAMFTWRNIRGTLVHTLDVERSWRLRLRGEERAVWEAELHAEQFENVLELETFWREDAAEMVAWLDGLADDHMAAEVDLGPRDRFPLWFFLAHIVTHGTEQRRDVSIQLKALGHDAPELEFLWYADSLREPKSASEG